jgi:hypothetical protein
MHNGSWVIAVETKANENSRTAAMLLFGILKENILL